MCENDGCDKAPPNVQARFCSRACQLDAYNARRRAGLPAPRRFDEPTTPLSAHVPESLADRLAAASQARHVTRSEVIREALAAWLEQHAAEEHTAA